MGTFYPSQTPFVDYWSTDAYISMKIERLRFYINYSNVDQLFDGIVDSQVLHHPQFDNIIKFGVNVILYD